MTVEGLILSRPSCGQSGILRLSAHLCIGHIHVCITGQKHSLAILLSTSSYFVGIGNKSVRKIIINNTINFIFNYNRHFGYFRTITVSECCLIKLLPYILFEKCVHILALEMGVAR